LTELVLLIESMSSAAISGVPMLGVDDADAVAETADVLQQQLVYNGEVLEFALDSLKAYRPGTQALAYLDAAVHLGYSLLRMLEKWTKGGGGKEMVVRKRKARRKKKKAAAEKAKTSVEEGEGVPDPAKDAQNEEALDEEELLALEEEEREREDQMREATFTFEAFELVSLKLFFLRVLNVIYQRFANIDVTTTLLTYLARYKDFGNSHDKMKYVVGLLHRQVVRAKAEGLLFTVSALDLFRTILADARSLPKDQAYKDLLTLVQFVLRRFFKAAERAPFLLVEAFFPKNKLTWREYSSLTKEELMAKTGKAAPDGTAVDRRFPPDVKLKKDLGYTWSQEVGIAIKALVDGGHKALVNWIKDVRFSSLAGHMTISDDMRRFS
jgi:replication fork protection complex subunit Tof1/Swi1